MDYYLTIIRNVYPTSYQPFNEWERYIFHLTDYKKPSFRDVFQFNAGDMFQWRFQFQPFGTGGAQSIHCTDTIFSKTSTPVSDNYNWRRCAAYFPFTPVDQPALVSDTAFLLSDALMPEEYPLQQSIVYRPADTTFCITGSYYALFWGTLNGISVIFFEPDLHRLVFKSGLGMLLNEWDQSASAAGTHTTWMTWYKKGNITCGQLAVGIKEEADNDEGLAFFPNPVSDFLVIKEGHGTSGFQTIWLTDAFGRLVHREPWHPSGLRMDLSRLPAGIYYLRTVDKTGRSVSRKVTICH